MTPLDTALRAAQQDPKRRDDFYNLFLNCTLIVPIHESKGLNGAPRRTTGGGNIVSVILQAEGRKVLPVFDTVERLEAWGQRAIQYVAIPGHALSDSIDPSIHWALNVGTEFFKEFVGEEIQWLKERLKGATPQAKTYLQGTQVLVGQPAKLPPQFLEQLRQLLQRSSEVAAAHLAQVLIEQPGEKPHSILVLKLQPFSEGAFQGIARDVGVFVQGALGPSEYLDIIPFTGKGLDATIVESVPAFYVRGGR